jgi:hypothetical protein
MLAAAGRFGGDDTAARKHEQKAHLLERLKALGLTDAQLAEIDRADREWVIFDCVIALLQPLNTSDDPTKRELYEKLFQNTHVYTPDECQGNRVKKSTPNETCQVVVVPRGDLSADAQGILLAGRF